MKNWPESLHQEIDAGDMNPSVLLGLADLPVAQATHLIRFLLKYRWTHSRQKELIRMVSELSRIQHRPLESICMEAETQANDASPATSLPQLADILRRCLLRQRYPHIQSTMDAYQNYKRTLSLPPNIQLLEPPDFEGETFRLQISFKNRKEFEEASDKLKEIADSPQLDAILKLT
jgi:hypothetical protein